MAVWFAGFCPDGDTCSKKQKRLCLCETVEEVHEKVAWHLQCSTYHSLNEHDAKVLAATCHIEEQVYEQDAEDHCGKAGAKDGKGKGKAAPKGGKGWQYHSSSSRAAPYEIQLRPQPVVHPHMAEVSAAVAAIGRCEAAARTASRMARSAALAFDEESAIMAAAVTKLQHIMEGNK